MDRSRWLCVWMLIFCCTPLVYGSMLERTQDEKASKKTEKSLIRMDLLKVKNKFMPPQRRNIFTVGRVEPVDELVPKDVTEKNLENADRTNNVQIMNSISSLNLRYIGYVCSDNKIVALVVFRGETVAVVEGDMIEEGITVGKVNREEIEIFWQDSKTEMFSIEGEFP